MVDFLVNVDKYIIHGWYGLFVDNQETQYKQLSKTEHHGESVLLYIDS